LPVEDVYPAIR